jgi:plastocyanin
MSKRVRGLLAAVALVVATGAAGCGGGDDAGGEATRVSVEAGTTLVATVGPGFDISLETEDGEAVAAAAPGEYTIEVSDESSIHNFHLTGPGVDEDSGIGEEGQSTWKVTLEPGSYVFICDPHPGMRGEVEVTG